MANLTFTAETRYVQGNADLLAPGDSSRPPF